MYIEYFLIENIRKMNFIQVSIYRIRSLKDASKKFKIEMNSKQLYMTGVTIVNPECSIVIVEGMF